MQNIFNFRFFYLFELLFFHDIWLWRERRLYVWCREKIKKTLNKFSFRDIFIYVNRFFKNFFSNKNNLVKQASLELHFYKVERNYFNFFKFETLFLPCNKTCYTFRNSDSKIEIKFIYIIYIYIDVTVYLSFFLSIILFYFGIFFNTYSTPCPFNIWDKLK